MMTQQASLERVRPLIPWPLAMPAAVLAGILMDFAYPDAALWPLAFPAVALLLCALIGRGVWMGLLIGLLHSVTFYLLLVSWTGRYLGVIPWLALAGVEAFLTAIGLLSIVLAYRWIPRAVRGRTARMLLLPITVAALWVGRELFLGSWPYSGFPWARLGMTQAEGPMAPVTSWVGVSGLSFLMVLLCALVIEIVRARAWPVPVRIVVPTGLAAVMVLLPSFPTTVVGTMRVAAVQGNGPTGYFDHREPYAVLEAQSKATEPLYSEDVDLLVWPEGGLGGDPHQDGTLARRITLVSNRIDAPLLANAATQRGDEFFNTSMLWLQDGTTEQSHDKRHPVPFGEYVPDRAFYNALVPELIGLLQRDYTPGTNAPVIDVDGDRVGLAICFDVIYDDVIREGLHGGAEVLVFQTNNADFRGTDENLQQLAFARMRAVETGRTVVNISTVGASQFIDADGTTISSLDADEAGALLEDVELRSGLTAGVVLGPWVQAVLLWGGLGMLVFSAWRGRRR